MSRRRRKDGGQGFLLLLALTVFLVIFVVRFCLTVAFYGLPFLLVAMWLIGWRPSGPTFPGKPEQFDDYDAWSRIENLMAARTRAYEALCQQYNIGDEYGLVRTSKSNEMLFHAGSKLGKKLNAVIEQRLIEINTLTDEVRSLRLSVLQKIPDWRSSVTKWVLAKRLNVCGVSGIIFLIIFVITAYSTSFLSDNHFLSAEEPLLWDPPTAFEKGPLIVAVFATYIAIITAFFLTSNLQWKKIDTSELARWQSLEDRWSNRIEDAHLEQPWVSEPLVERNEGFAESWHVVLGVAPDASSDDIKAAYRNGMKQYHPDRVAGLGVRLQEVAEAESKRLNEAYMEARAERGF